MSEEENPKQSSTKPSADTKVDDMLMEMIAPKVLEIEEKFANGQGLTQDDINTLLLKSQYNHINHLDLKLDAVTDSVIALEGKFMALEGKFMALEGKFVELEDKFETKFLKLESKFELRFVELESKFKIRFVELEAKFETKFVELEAKFDTKFAELEAKFDTKFVELEANFGRLKSDIEVIVAKAMNKNMMMIFAAMGAFLILSKLIDKLF